MKILRGILLIAGVVLIGFGLVNLFIPEYATITNDSNNQVIGIMGLGVLAILASVFAKNRR